MKRSLILLMVVGLVFGALAGPVSAKKKVKRTERVVEIEYTGGNAGVATPAATGGTCLNGGPGVFACQSAPGTSKETYVKVEVTDASGQKAGGFISQGDDDGDGIDDGYAQFCGGHTAPVALTHPGAPVDISLYPGICSDASGPSVVTTGTIKVTFSNMP